MANKIFKSKDKDGNEVELRFNDLNQVVLTKGDFVYREYFSKAIRAGVMTQAEATKILKDRNIWSDNDEDELINYKVKISQLQSKLNEMNKRDADSLALYDQIKSLRTKVADLGAIRSDIIDNTAESMATEMRTQFFASECAVYNNSGKRVFQNLEDFRARLDEDIATDSYRESLILNYERALGISIPDNTEDMALPEDKWLEEVRDKEEKEIEKVEATPPKKTRTRKKKTS